MWPFRFAMHRKRGLRMMVVSLLSQSPKNGVEIMDGVEAMTRGWWRPTPGAIYPLLNSMSEEGTVKKREDGKYELTPQARRELDASFVRGPQGPQDPGEAVTQMHGFVSYLEDVKSSKEGDLDPHREKLKGLAKRLSDLVGKDEPGSEEP